MTELWQHRCFYSDSRKINAVVVGGCSAAEGTLVRGNVSVYKTLYTAHLCVWLLLWEILLPTLDLS